MSFQGVFWSLRIALSYKRKQRCHLRRPPPASRKSVIRAATPAPRYFKDKYLPDASVAWLGIGLSRDAGDPRGTTAPPSATPLRLWLGFFHVNKRTPRRTRSPNLLRCHACFAHPHHSLGRASSAVLFSPRSHAEHHSASQVQTWRGVRGYKHDT